MVGFSRVVFWTTPLEIDTDVWSHATGKPLTPDPPKSLQQGCSTTLVAALDPSIEGT